MSNVIRLRTWNFPDYAKDYYGSDVQKYWFERQGDEYRIMQERHWLGLRCAAKVYASNVTDAKRQLFAFCEPGQVA
jgi:hypothetical protein